jgi:hypothetical protein
MSKDEALDKMAENARELGLDYEPVLKDNSNYRYDPPVAEPVGYWLIGTDHVEFDKHEYHDGPEWEAIYTTPPAAQRQWVGLTDKQKSLDNAPPHFDRSQASAWQDGVYWAEAKLKEKNT